ncbi:hypothetical protein DFJ74DRAFT_185449 [Hyaloraphidium curvatum]|nr:hypothetical protein DFJ74DRAFT_185449 [Hyaloraphidium curvatum]
MLPERAAEQGLPAQGDDDGAAARGDGGEVVLGAGEAGGDRRRGAPRAGGDVGIGVVGGGVAGCGVRGRGVLGGGGGLGLRGGGRLGVVDELHRELVLLLCRGFCRTLGRGHGDDPADVDRGRLQPAPDDGGQHLGLANDGRRAPLPRVEQRPHAHGRRPREHPVVRGRARFRDALEGLGDGVGELLLGRPLVQPLLLGRLGVDLEVHLAAAGGSACAVAALGRRVGCLFGGARLCPALRIRLHRLGLRRGRGLRDHHLELGQPVARVRQLLRRGGRRPALVLGGKPPRDGGDGVRDGLQRGVDVVGRARGEEQRRELGGGGAEDVDVGRGGVESVGGGGCGGSRGQTSSDEGDSKEDTDGLRFRQLGPSSWRRSSAAEAARRSALKPSLNAASVSSPAARAGGSNYLPPARVDLADRIGEHAPQRVDAVRRESRRRRLHRRRAAGGFRQHWVPLVRRRPDERRQALGAAADRRVCAGDAARGDSGGLDSGTTVWPSVGPLNTRMLLLWNPGTAFS